MSTKVKNPYADTEFVRAFHTERRECEAAYDVCIFTSITTAIRPDRVVIRHEAYLLDVPRADQKPLCSVTWEWPNPTSMSFPAALFRSAVEMSRMVQDSCTDLWKDTLRAQNKG